MPSFFPRRPFFGSTDWGARQFLGLLDQEDREKAERRRLQEAGWRPDSASVPPATEPEPRFGDGRDALADLVQAELDHRQALQDEARRRVNAQLAQARPETPPLPPRKPELPGAPQAQTPAFPIPPQKPADIRAQQSGTPSSESGPTEDDYGYDDAWSDYRRSRELLDYVAQGAAVSEMVGSQLPGRERGPADAYRHILWAAELTRRFGEQRARAILGLHEREGDMQRQPADERAMDVNNNEIGIQIGIGARGFNDVIGAARKVISGSAPDGRGQWQEPYDPASTSAPFAASWLPEARWQKNPSYDRLPPGRPLGGPRAAGASMEMPTSETNWYSNPNRPNGPDWVGGYVSDGYRYPYGGREHVTGPRDPLAQRAEDAYRFLLDRPWLYYPSKLFW